MNGAGCRVADDSIKLYAQKIFRIDCVDFFDSLDVQLQFFCIRLGLADFAKHCLNAEWKFPDGPFDIFLNALKGKVGTVNFFIPAVASGIEFSPDFTSFFGENAKTFSHIWTVEKRGVCDEGELEGIPGKFVLRFAHQAANIGKFLCHGAFSIARKANVLNLAFIFVYAQKWCEVFEAVFFVGFENLFEFLLDAENVVWNLRSGNVSVYLAISAAERAALVEI